MRVLEAVSHANRLAISSAGQLDGGTEPAYMCHFNSYMSWWPMDQAQRKSGDPSWKEIPALPITATKVSLFLAHEITREKKKRNSSEMIAGTTVGKSQILQVISALEHYQLNHQHEYPNNREAQIKLREDTRIRAYESAAKHNEPKRAESAQSQKAAGRYILTGGAF
ncbi:hypothetical protein FB451DRAFT_1498168 [Mycena latifolia]|nr:hypothetical protein FB451DRAFT_1498168 [Mycena latifolia]